MCETLLNIHVHKPGLGVFAEAGPRPIVTAVWFNIHTTNIGLHLHRPVTVPAAQ